MTTDARGNLHSKTGKFTNKQPTHDDVTLPGVPMLAGTPAPVVELSGLTHIGTLNAADKGTSSYEGQGLSVSQHPEAWEQIARLGGNPTWSIGATGQFLNFRKLTAEQRAAIAEFGIAAGYVEEITAYTVSYYDEEYEEERNFTVVDVEDAEAEAEEWDGEITEATVLVATATFPDSTVRAGSTDVEDVLATVWVNETTDLDGVWWQDRYDPDQLSAPRGVIVPNRVADWVATATPRTS